jgi:hypothetical protein
MDPKEIEVVQLILKLREAGKTLWAIAHHLNDLGYRNRRGTLWEHSLVRNIAVRHKGKIEELEKRIQEVTQPKGKIQ